MASIRRWVWGSGLLLALVAAGCEEKKPSVSTPEADAGEVENAQAVDPSLAKAVAQVEKQGGGAATTADAGDGPPESGVFAPGKADELHKKGTPPLVKLGQAGSAPREVLKVALSPGDKRKGNVELTMRSGRNVLPGIDLSLSIEAQKPKPGEDGIPVLVKVVGAKVGDIQGQPAPKELSAQVSKTKGSKVEYRLLPNGAAVDPRYELAKGADENLNMVLRSLMETLTTASLVVPKEAVGAGAMWMVTSREFVGGADVVAYRLVKLDSVDKDKLSITVSAKRYAASPKLTLMGLPPGKDLSLEQFQSTADGQLEVLKGHSLPGSGTLKSTLLAALSDGTQSDQRVGVQAMADATLSIHE
ncbi:MAG: hypothetical protein KC776_23690 [Myxococcales bacterium]|nr:hypothetical protein [Myxococcales bacterium]MCB9580346.1 hypothetical protein [Polyangiaceae bacterium]